MTERPSETGAGEDSGEKLTSQEFGHFFKDAFDYSRGRPGLQQLFNFYAFQKRPDWPATVLQMDTEEVMQPAVQQLTSLIKAGGHKAIGRTVPILEWEATKRAARDSMEHRHMPMPQLLFEIFRLYCAVDWQFLNGSRNQILEDGGRSIHTSGFRKVNRSFLYDHALKGMPLRAGTHPVFKELFDDLRALILSPDPAKSLEEVSEWKSICEWMTRANEWE